MGRVVGCSRLQKKIHFLRLNPKLHAHYQISFMTSKIKVHISSDVGDERVFFPPLFDFIISFITTSRIYSSVSGIFLSTGVLYKSEDFSLHFFTLPFFSILTSDLFVLAFSVFWIVELRKCYFHLTIVPVNVICRFEKVYE